MPTTPDPLLITCVGVTHDLALLPHFLAHYTALGVKPERIRPILNATEPDDPGLAEARDILAAHGVTAAENWIAPYTSASMWQMRREVQDREAGADDWVLSADVDEFHEYPEPLPDFLARMEEMGVTCVQGVFIDRLAPGGRLAPVNEHPGVLEQFPIEADVIWSLAGSHGYDRRGTVKIMALKPPVRPGKGGHRPERDRDARHLYGFPLGDFPGIDSPATRFAVPTRVHHVHWTDSLPERLRIRLDTPGVSRAGAAYGRIQLDHFETHGGVALDRVARARGDETAGWQHRLTRLRREGRARRALEPLRRLAAKVTP